MTVRLASSNRTITLAISAGMRSRGPNRSIASASGSTSRGPVLMFGSKLTNSVLEIGAP